MRPSAANRQPPVDATAILLVLGSVAVVIAAAVALIFDGDTAGQGSGRPTGVPARPPCTASLSVLAGDSEGWTFRLTLSDDVVPSSRHVVVMWPTGDLRAWGSNGHDLTEADGTVTLTVNGSAAGDRPLTVTARSVKSSEADAALTVIPQATCSS